MAEELSSYRESDTSDFYDAYARSEWGRLEATAYGRLQAVIHTDFLREHILAGDRVLDAGCGPGRFSVEMARLGARLTLLDTSSVQLDLAREHIEQEGFAEQVEDYVQADIVDLSRFPDGSFDVAVCYGGALSYVRDRRFDAVRELVRVTRPGGKLLVSVMSRYGASANLVRRPVTEFLKGQWEPMVWNVIETGDLSGVPSTKVPGQTHPSMHLFASDELVGLFSACEVITLAGSNVTATEATPALDELATDPDAWTTAVEMERRLCTKQGLVDNGGHIILVARRGEEAGSA